MEMGILPRVTQASAAPCHMHSATPMSQTRTGSGEARTCFQNKHQQVLFTPTKNKITIQLTNRFKKKMATYDREVNILYIKNSSKKKKTIGVTKVEIQG